MNVDEAYKILEVDQDTSEKDLNKKFRKLAAKYHPDINKDLGAEEKSKQISEAFNTIKEAKNAPQQPNFNFNVSDFQQQVRFNWGNSKKVRNPFHDFFQQIPDKDIINVKTTISFKESVTGTNRKISYERDIPCQSCSGNGYNFDSINCVPCSGQGFSINQQTVSINGKNQKINFKENCFECEGHGKKKNNCSDCNSSGEKKGKLSLDVKIPAGIHSGQKMNLSEQGHHVYQNQFTDCHLEVEVTPEDNMMLSGDDVISNINITLLEALKGTSKDVKTVYGEKPLIIPKLSKNKDNISIAMAGVERRGSHVFVVNILYPENIDGLINYLEPKIEEVAKEESAKIESEEGK